MDELYREFVSIEEDELTTEQKGEIETISYLLAFLEFLEKFILLPAEPEGPRGEEEE